ncbi:arsenate reductase family protein [Changchengzhania lutea]|uniref:arsenate reductase family protein n=1 Tax=Changchengzhania lutea TaxID=2049305 RepID=UPI00115C762C|nr:hypothetical protein [Changchengzhania lutea]
MGILATDKHQLTYIYSSDSDLGKKVLAYANSVDKHIQTIELEKTKIADTIWAELSEKLNIPFSELFVSDHPDAPELGDGSDFSDHDWIKLINANPALLQQPIAINGEKYRVITNRFDFFEFFGVDSAGIEKGHTMDDAIEDENFK